MNKLAEFASVFPEPGDVMGFINDDHVPVETADDIADREAFLEQRNWRDDERVFRELGFDVGLVEALSIEE